MDQILEALANLGIDTAQISAFFEQLMANETIATIVSTIQGWIGGISG